MASSLRGDAGAAGTDLFPPADHMYMHTRLWKALVEELQERLEKGELKASQAKKMVKLFNEAAGRAFELAEEAEADKIADRKRNRAASGDISAGRAPLSAPRMVGNCHSFRGWNDQWWIEATDAVLTMRDRSQLLPDRITIYALTDPVTKRGRAKSDKGK